MPDNVIHIDEWLTNKYMNHKEKCLAFLNLSRMSTDIQDLRLAKAFSAEAKEQSEKAKQYKSLRDERRNSLSKTKYQIIYTVTFEIPAWA